MRGNEEEKIQLLANLVESSDDAIITKSLDGFITTWNKGAEIIYGYSAEEVIGKNISILAPVQLKDEIEQLIEKIKNGEKVDHYETVRIRKDGEQVDVSITLSPIFDNHGNLMGISSIARDITQSKKLELALKESEEKFHEIFNNANDMIFLNRINDDGLPGKFIDVNKVGISRLGFSHKEFLNMTPADIVVPDKLSEMPKNALKLSEKGFLKFEIIHQTKDGKRIPVEVNNHLFKLNGKKVALAISRDISERKNAEKVFNAYDDLELRVQERTAELVHVNVILKAEIKERKRMEEIIQDNIRSMNLALESANMGALDIDILNDTSIRTVDHDKIFGYDSLLPEWGLKIFFKHILPEDLDYVQERFETSFNTKKLYFQCRIIRVDKEIRWIEGYGNVYDNDKGVPVRILGVVSDITERKETETRLLKAIEEKEMLLREVHHRVKNNMQIISSFLSLQSSQVFDKRDADLFTVVQDRVKSMALVHDNLYHSEDLSRIKFKDYISALSSQMFANYKESSNIKLITDILDVTLNMETAIPLGLIISELITNSLKHAFPDNAGEISIKMYDEGEKFVLIFNDNGVGLPKDFDIKNPKKLGLKLINTLVEQLEGVLELETSHGTEYKIIFKELNYKERL